jgi:hypothetical protein
MMQGIELSDLESDTEFGLKGVDKDQFGMS